MRRLFLPLFVISFCLQLNAQITIERSDYLLEIGDTTFFWMTPSPDNIPLPTEGEDLVWDYSTVNFSTNAPFRFYHPAGTDANFADANIVVATSTTGFIPGLTLPVTFVSRLDEEGHRTLGRIDSPAAVPLAGTTGGPNDSLNFTGTVNIYESPVIDAYFPMNYNDSQTGILTARNPFLLTVAAFGLDHTPGSGDFLFTNSINVVGWGTLQVPDVDGGDAIELEVLLRKDVTIIVDTFTLGGAPAPQALLDAFGLTQGRVRESTEYSFWAKGLDAAVMVFTLESDGSRIVRINRDIPIVISSTRGIAENLQALSITPNPSTQDFQIAFEQSDIPATQLSVLNTLGQIVHQQSITASQGEVQTQISLNGTPGIYQVLLLNEKGQITGREKILLIE